MLIFLGIDSQVSYYSTEMQFFLNILFMYMQLLITLASLDLNISVSIVFSIKRRLIKYIWY